MVKYTKCVTKIMTISGRKKCFKICQRENKTERQLVVGPKGGVSYKPPNSKTRRYVSSICKKTDCSKSFGRSEKTSQKEITDSQKTVNLLFKFVMSFTQSGFFIKTF